MKKANCEIKLKPICAFGCLTVHLMTIGAQNRMEGTLIGTVRIYIRTYDVL